MVYMQKIVKKIFSAPAIRLKTLVVIEVVTLLLVSLGGLFYYTRKALVEESKMDAEQRLEGTVQHVDNILLTIEQTAGNVYYAMLENLDRPERIKDYCRRMVEGNTNILGCVIAFKPDYYPEKKMFINYVFRKKYNSPELIVSDDSVNIPYTQQKWYSETMTTCRPSWLDPGQYHEYKTEQAIAYCLPIIDRNSECVGVIAVGLSINMLSQIIQGNKPSPNSYSVLLAHDGSYIIHPDREKLTRKTIFERTEIAESPSAMSAVKSMLKGETGNMSFKMDDFTWYLFYKPFVRNNLPGRHLNALKWSIATVYPKSDIFGEYNHLVLHVLGIVLIALLVFYMFCKRAIKKQMKPLIYLTESAERIAEGHYDETIPNVKRDDEIGVFYKHFQDMQKALAAHVAKLEEQRATMTGHHEKLQKMAQQMQDDNQVKTTFLHNITNKMIAPAESLSNSVDILCDRYEHITLAEANKEIDNIKQQSENILELLSQKFDASTNNTGKEASHE